MADVKYIAIWGFNMDVLFWAREPQISYISRCRTFNRLVSHVWSSSTRSRVTRIRRLTSPSWDSSWTTRRRRPCLLCASFPKRRLNTMLLLDSSPIRLILWRARSMESRSRFSILRKSRLRLLAISYSIPYIWLDQAPLASTFAIHSQHIMPFLEAIHNLFIYFKSAQRFWLVFNL